MARNRSVTQTVTTTTVTRDAADILVDALNEIDGIAFVRDAWEDKAPDDYGVVETTDQSNALYADNHMVAQEFRMTVHLYAKGGSNAWIAKIQKKLNEATDGYAMSQHEYLWDIGKNHWAWNVYFIAPLQWEEVVTGGTVGV